MSISKIFIPNFVCVLTNERYKTYQTGFLFCRLGHAQGVGLWGTGDIQGVKHFFFQTWSCSISNPDLFTLKVAYVLSRRQLCVVLSTDV